MRREIAARTRQSFCTKLLAEPGEELRCKPGSGHIPADERTLRRAQSSGMLAGVSPGPRRGLVSSGTPSPSNSMMAETGGKRAQLQ